MAGEHSQAKAIEEQHAALLRHWEQLLEASRVHRQKLLEKQLPLQKVRKEGTERGEGQIIIKAHLTEIC